MEYLEARLGLPLYFVLGNHDFYRGGIARIRAAIGILCARSPKPVYLTWASAVGLMPETGLVGHWRSSVRRRSAR